MHLTSQVGLRHPYRLVQLPKAFHEVLAGPPRGDPLYVEGGARFWAWPLRRRRHTGSRVAICGTPREAGGGLGGNDESPHANRQCGARGPLPAATKK